MVFTKRQIEIIEQIMNHVSGITGDRLAKSLNVSSRTIRNDILQINSSLKEKISIKASRRNGYYITNEELPQFKTIINRKNSQNKTIPFENRGYWILSCVLDQGTCDLFDLEEELFLSQSSIREEILRLNKGLSELTEVPVLLLKGSQLSLTKNEEAVRLVLFHLMKSEIQTNQERSFNQLKYLFRKNFDEAGYFKFFRIVQQYFENHEIQVSDAGLYLVVDTIYMVLLRKSGGNELEGIGGQTYESEVLSNFLSHLRIQGIQLTETDEKLLKTLLYSIPFVQGPRDQKAGVVSNAVLQDFCHDVMKKYSFDLHQSDELFDKMALHLEYLIRRIDTGCHIDNPLLQEIKSQYPYAYEIAMGFVPILYKYKKVHISDAEIAYMALYIAYFFNKVNKRLKAVVISVSRLSVHIIITDWLQVNFENQIEVIKVLPEHQLSSFLKDNRPDIIISANEQRIIQDIPLFQIRGIPGQQDYNSLNGLIRRIRMSKRFYGIIDKYFDEAHIGIFREPTTFENVIQQLSAGLEEHGKVRNAEEFSRDVLSREINYPTVIGQVMMIPHPLMTFAVKTAVSTAVIRQPLMGKYKDIKLIFLLAIEGRPNDDVEILFEFFKQVSEKEGLIKQLYQSESNEDFLKRLIKVSASLELY